MPTPAEQLAALAKSLRELPTLAKMSPEVRDILRAELKDVAKEATTQYQATPLGRALKRKRLKIAGAASLRAGVLSGYLDAWGIAETMEQGGKLKAHEIKPRPGHRFLAWPGHVGRAVHHPGARVKGKGLLQKALDKRAAAIERKVGEATAVALEREIREKLLRDTGLGP